MEIKVGQIWKSKETDNKIMIERVCGPDLFIICRYPNKMRLDYVEEDILKRCYTYHSMDPIGSPLYKVLNA